MVCVSASTVCRFEHTGDVSASQATPRIHRLHEHGIGAIELVYDEYLHEIQSSLLQTSGTNASTATICNTLLLLLTSFKFCYFGMIPTVSISRPRQ